MINLSLNQLRRFVLSKQGLLERQPLEAMTTFGPLHDTSPTTPYLSLLARLEPFVWQNLADKRYHEHAFIKLRCMRRTLHLIPLVLADTVRCAYRLAEDEPFIEFENYNIPEKAAMAARFAIMDTLEREGPQTAASIKKYLGANFQKKYQHKYGAETTIIGPVLRWLWSLGLVEQGIGVTDWRQKELAFLIVDTPPVPCDRAEADAALAQAYFSLYAPATYEDWVWWCGLSAERCKNAFDRLKLVKVKVSGLPEQFWCLETQVESLTQTPDALPEMVRLLPYEDALIKAYKPTRTRFYDDAGIAEDSAFTQFGEAVPTLWVDGQIMGVWTWIAKPNEPMTIEPFHQMTKALRKRLHPEVERVKHFIQASHVIWSS